MAWFAAASSGLIAGGALLAGAFIAWFVRVSTGVVASVMAFGAGVLISALAFELVAEANRGGGLLPTVGGCLAGAVIYVVADALLLRAGARRSTDRRRSGGGGGLGIALGALIDGIPESIVLGLSVVVDGTLSLPILVAITISNVPESLSSTADLKAEGRSAGYVFGLWGSIAALSTLAALLGFLLLREADPFVLAFVTAIAAGGILAMVSNTMIPEAFRRERALTGLYATLGFLASFALHELA